MSTASKPRRALLGALATVAILAGLELGLRLLPAPDPAWLATPESTLPGFHPIMMRGNPYLLWELNPGRLHMDQGDVTIDSHGFRGPERGPKARTRFMVFGDSSVYGAGVGDGQTFSAVMEEKLGVDVVNAAVPGYSSEQALNALLLKGLALEPDVLVVATLWSDNNFDKFVDREVLSRYAAWTGTGAAAARGILADSRVFSWLDLGVQWARSGVKVKTVGWMQLDHASAGGRRRVPIGDYAANLARFCTIMAERGGGVLFVMLPNRNDLTRAEADPPWPPYRQAMRDSAAACGAPLVDLPAIYAAAGGDPGALFSDEMHPNVEGHRRIAEAVMRTLAEAGWPEKPLRAKAISPVAPPEDRFEGHGVELGLVAPGSPLVTGDAPPPTPGPPGRPGAPGGPDRGAPGGGGGTPGGGPGGALPGGPPRDTLPGVTPPGAP